MPAVEPLRWASAANEEAHAARLERTLAWKVHGYKTKQIVTLSSSLAEARGRKVQAMFASRTPQHSCYSLTHDLRQSPSAAGSRHATAKTPLYSPQSLWLKDPRRNSAAFASKMPVHTRANSHPLIPPAAPDCWIRQAIAAEVFSPLEVLKTENNIWIRPMRMPASLERTGDRYSNIVSWPLLAPGPGEVVESRRA